MSKPLRIIALDYGTQKIGLAVGQTLTNRGQPLGIVPVRRHEPLWDQMDQHLQQWQPDRLILGLPLNMDGSESEMSTEVRAFAKKLSKRYNLPIAFIDERLSSKEARNALNNINPSKSKSPKLAVDAMAAALIAETWLQEHTKKP